MCACRHERTRTHACVLGSEETVTTEHLLCAGLCKHHPTCFSDSHSSYKEGLIGSAILPMKNLMFKGELTFSRSHSW